MHAIEEKGTTYHKRNKGNRELTPAEPPASLFKVVVNNYRQEKEKLLEEPDEDSDATIIAPEYGLPPQPVRYIKYPKYDWF
jgi:hypothetical protein